MLALGNPDAREVLLVLGRQHPPETTGTQALMGFVDELAADSPLASDFRERTLVIVLPLLNPDGVVEGNWPGNTTGHAPNLDGAPSPNPTPRPAPDPPRARFTTDSTRAASAPHLPPHARDQ